MSSALKRGRTLDPAAVKMARDWRKKRIKELESKSAGQFGLLNLSNSERHELYRFRGYVR